MSGRVGRLYVELDTADVAAEQIQVCGLNSNAVFCRCIVWRSGMTGPAFSDCVQTLIAASTESSVQSDLEDFLHLVATQVMQLA